jgi:hypothetical protein
MMIYLKYHPAINGCFYTKAKGGENGAFYYL